MSKEKKPHLRQAAEQGYLQYYESGSEVLRRPRASKPQASVSIRGKKYMTRSNERSTIVLLRWTRARPMAVGATEMSSVNVAGGAACETRVWHGWANRRQRLARRA